MVTGCRLPRGEGDLGGGGGGGGGGACVITLWGSLTGGDEKGFLDFLTLVDERQHQEILVSAFKPKESRELKCSINFDARGVGYSQGKGERALTLLYCSPWFSAGFCHGALGVSSILFLFLFFLFNLFWCPLYASCSLMGAFDSLLSPT
jgi:hypothetical protein